MSCMGETWCRAFPQLKEMGIAQEFLVLIMSNQTKNKFLYEDKFKQLF